MNRALHVLGALAWGVMVAGTLLWWAPSLLFVLARWQASRLRFEVSMGLGVALVRLGWPEVASRLYGAEAERAKRSMLAKR